MGDGSMLAITGRSALRWGAVLAAVLLAAGPFALESAKAVQPTFTTIDLQSPDRSSYPSGLSESGQVIVNSQDDQGIERTANWSSSGRLVGVGNFAGADAIREQTSIRVDRLSGAVLTTPAFT